MVVTLTSDYIGLEKEERKSAGGLLMAPSAVDPRNVVIAKVIAVGPGEQRPDGGMYEMPCAVGDRVFVNAGAGIKWTSEETGLECWVVYAGRKDIIGVEVLPEEPETAA